MAGRSKTNIAGPCVILELARLALGILLPDDGPVPVSLIVSSL